MLCASLLMFSDHRSETLTPIRAALSWVLHPIVWLATFPHGVVDAAGDLQTRETLEAENKTLREKQLMLESRLQKFSALAAENRRIRELLSSASQIEEKVIIAEIISVNQDPYRHQISLDKGQRDGVYRGQALVDAHGIMGQVIDVAPGTSRALLITDPDHGIPVQINRTGLQTIAIGRGDGRGLKLPFLPSNADVRQNDLLVSSSLGGRFPSGYPVGQIYEVKHTAGEHFMEAYAYPAAKLHQGNQALLVWNDLPDVDMAGPADTEQAPVGVLTGKPPAPTAPAKPGDKPRPADKPAATKPTDKPAAAKPADKPVVKPAATKPAPPAATKPANTPADKPADKPAVAPAKPAVAKPVEPTAAKPAPKPVAPAAPATDARAGEADDAMPPSSPPPPVSR